MSALHAGRMWDDDELEKLGELEGWSSKELEPFAEVLVLPTGTSTLTEEPRPLSLVPCATKGTETEVEHLLRMHAAGEIVPVPVRLPPLSATSTGAMHCVADFYVLVRGVRLWAGDDRAVPFACGWVGDKTGLPKRTTARALLQLTDAGVITFAGALPGRGARGTHTYLPGGAA